MAVELQPALAEPEVVGTPKKVYLVGVSVWVAASAADRSDRRQGLGQPQPCRAMWRRGLAPATVGPVGGADSLRSQEQSPVQP